MIYTDIICPNTIGILSKSSRRDTIIVNCQLSIVNSAKPLNSKFVVSKNDTEGVRALATTDPVRHDLSADTVGRRIILV